MFLILVSFCTGFLVGVILVTIVAYTYYTGMNNYYFGPVNKAYTRNKNGN